MCVFKTVTHAQVFVGVVKQGIHGLLHTVALNQPLHPQVALFSTNCYLISGLVWILLLHY